VLALASALAERFPVPVAAFPAGTISLSAIFIVAAGVLYGWDAAVVVGFVARASLELAQRRPVAKLLFNGALYALSGRPHWGQVNYLTGDLVRSMYPRFDDWLRVRERLDPEGTFDSPFTKRVGISRRGFPPA